MRSKLRVIFISYRLDWRNIMIALQEYVVTDLQLYGFFTATVTKLAKVEGVMHEADPTYTIPSTW